MARIRDGVIGVLTHEDNVVFLSLPEEDVITRGNGGKEKRERAEGDELSVVLSTSMLGLVSGGVKEEKLLEQMNTDEMEKIVFETLRREAEEEFDLEVDFSDSEIKRDGFIEQFRRDEVIVFLLWVVSRVMISEAEISRLRDETDTEVILVKEKELKEFLNSQGDRIRPAAQQAIKTAYNL